MNTPDRPEYPLDLHRGYNTPFRLLWGPDRTYAQY